MTHITVLFFSFLNTLHLPLSRTNTHTHRQTHSALTTRPWNTNYRFDLWQWHYLNREVFTVEQRNMNWRCQLCCFRYSSKMPVLNKKHWHLWEPNRKVVRVSHVNMRTHKHRCTQTHKHLKGENNACYKQRGVIDNHKWSSCTAQIVNPNKHLQQRAIPISYIAVVMI